MMPRFDENIVHFPVEEWHLLTELPGQPTSAQSRAAKVTSAAAKTHERKMGPREGVHPALLALNANTVKVMFDLMTYPFSSVRVRIKRLGLSARAFEHAKLEGCEKGFMVESAAGATKYLIPLPKTFEVMGFICPYDLSAMEHSYYEGLCRFLLEKDPVNKSVHTELKVGNSGSTADIVTVGHGGLRHAYEVTLSTGNILSNAAKYSNTDFVQIVFLCRDYQLRQAVKACCREGGLDPNLLARLDYWQFSTLLRRQRKLSLY